MAPVTKNRSIRLNNDLWAWLEDEAPRRGLTVNGMVSGLVEAERGKAADVAAPVKAARAAPAKTPTPQEKFAGRTALGEPLPVKRAKPKGQK